MDGQGEGDRPPGTPVGGIDTDWQRNWLKRNRCALLDRMETMAVVDVMVQEDSMDIRSEVYEKIAAKREEKRTCARCLLDFLSGQTTKCFDDFFTALGKTRFPDLSSLFTADEKKRCNLMVRLDVKNGLSASEFPVVDKLAEQLRRRYRQLNATSVCAHTCEWKAISPESLVMNISLLSTDQLDEHQNCPSYKKPFTYPMTSSKGFIDLKNVFNKDTAGEAPRRLIATGCSGAGKTTAFTIKAPYEWAKEGSDFWQQFKLFFYGSFNDTKWRDAESLADVFHLNEFQLTEAEQKEVLAYIREHPDKVLLVADSLEEAPEPKQSSMLLKVLSGKERGLLNLNVVVSSRPCRITAVLSKDCPFDQRVEVAGFTPDKIKRYVEWFFSQDPDKVSHLMIATKHDRPKVLSLMHTPILASMICKLFQLERELPSTYTEVYHSAVLAMLKQSTVRSLTELPPSLLNDSPSALQQAVDDLSKLAFSGVKEKHTMFSHTELGEANCLGPALDLGFLSAATAKHDLKENMYSFQHHTMLEFFAAVHAVKQRLRDGKRQSVALLVQELGLGDDRSAFWWFVSGLLQGSMSEHLLDVMTEAFMETKELDCRRLLLCLLLQCHLECDAKLPEEGSTAVANLIKSSGFDLENVRLTAMDIRALSCSLRRYHAAVEKLLINRCNINDNDMTELLLGLQKCKRIRLVDLSQNKLSMRSMVGVSEVIKQNAKTLTQVSVDVNEAGYDGMDCLAPAIKACSHLERLDVGDETMTRGFSRALADILRNMHGPGLRHLGLSAPLDEDGGTVQLCEALKINNHHTSLRVVFIYKPGISLCELSKLLPQLSKLEKFTLLGHDRVDDEGLKQITLSLSSLEYLKTVRLLDMGITSQQTAVVVQSVQRMRNMEFCFISCKESKFLDDEELEIVMANFPVPIEHPDQSKSEDCLSLFSHRKILTTMEGQSPKVEIWFHEN